MVAFDSDAEIIKHYRVDKMADISITDQQRDGKEHFESLDMGTYAKKVFGMDVTNYLATYRCTARELVMTIIQDVLKTTGITATAGIGTNLYLCKIAMIARAMKITGLDATLTDSEMVTLLASYTDSANASDYAKTSIAACLKTGVVTGRSNSTVAPKENITRAEVAVIVQRLLKDSKLI